MNEQSGTVASKVKAYSELSDKSTGTMEKKTYQNILRYYRVNFGRINWKSIEMSIICFGNGIQRSH